MRKANWHEDGLAIVAACEKLQQYAASYGFTGKVDFELGCSNLRRCIDQLGQGYIHRGYLIMVDVVRPWYSNDPVLQEWLVLKVHAEVAQGVEDIPKQLLQLAKVFHCNTAITADSSPVNIMGKAYEAAGFKKLTTSYYKET